MEGCDQLLALLRNDPAEWAVACSRLKAMFEKLPTDAKVALVAGDDCIPTLLHVIGREASGGDAGANASMGGACEALNALITGLPKGVKEALLKGEKGVVDALLRVLANAKGTSAWGFVGFCFRNLFLDVAAEMRQQLLSDGRGIAEAIVGVLDGDEATAWAGAGGALISLLNNVSVCTKQSLLRGERGIVIRIIRVLGNFKHGGWGCACSCMSGLLADLPPSAKSTFLLSQPLLVTTIISCLDNEDAHICWAGAMRLLKRLVYQEASLSHINLCTLHFLSNDCGMMSVLLRCSLRFSTDADNLLFRSVCSVFYEASFYTANPPHVAFSPQILILVAAAARLCADDAALRALGTAMSNQSEVVSYCSVLADAKFLEYSLSKIAGVSAADAVWNDAYSVPTTSLSVIVNMSRNEALRAKLQELHVIDILAPIASEHCAAQLRVLMALSYIIGCKETKGKCGSDASALFQLSSSSSIGKIVDCLENTLNLEGGPGYSFGSVMLPAILQVWMHRCFSSRFIVYQLF
jgi:hypothetical protein